VFIPKADKPVPCFVYFMHNAQQISTDIENEPNTMYIPIADIGKRGYAVAVIYFNVMMPGSKAPKQNFENLIFYSKYKLFILS